MLVWLGRHFFTKSQSIGQISTLCSPPLPLPSPSLLFFVLPRARTETTMELSKLSGWGEERPWVESNGKHGHKCGWLGPRKRSQRRLRRASTKFRKTLSYPQKPCQPAFCSPVTGPTLLDPFRTLLPTPADIFFFHLFFIFSI